MKYIKLLRPSQWCKNFFLFLPLFFGHAIGNLDRLLSVGIAFVAFCLVSSSIYILNDLRDAEFDRLHPEKSQRPIASGQVTVSAAVALHVFLLALSVALCLLLNRAVLYVIAAYYLMNVAYCFGLKRIALLDVVIIALGFVLRIMAGAVAGAVEPSQWIVIMTFLLALFLALSKRRDDVLRYEQNRLELRSNVVKYNREFLNQSFTLVAAVTLVSYVMYTVDESITARMGSRYVYATSVFVLTGILRYLQLVLVEEKSWSPTRILLHDRFLQLCIAGWLLSFAIIIYG